MDSSLRKHFLTQLGMHLVQVTHTLKSSCNHTLQTLLRNNRQALPMLLPQATGQQRQRAHSVKMLAPDVLLTNKQICSLH